MRVGFLTIPTPTQSCTCAAVPIQEERLVGATLLIFANKQDIPSALPLAELQEVCRRLVC
jgi:signal recognition particle receptor subunit beta